MQSYLNSVIITLTNPAVQPLSLEQTGFINKDKIKIKQITHQDNFQIQEKQQLFLCVILLI